MQQFITVEKVSQSGNPHADSAYDAGVADAMAAIDNGGWEYAGGTLEDSYRLGWLAGTARRNTGHLPTLAIPAAVDASIRARCLDAVRAERDAMDADLADIRSGKVSLIVRLTDTQLAEIEAERWGE